MALTPGTPAFTRSPHLVGLIAEAERLATVVAGADPDARDTRRAAARDAAALASLRLDGGHLDAPPADDDLRAARAAVRRDDGSRPGTWFDAMGVTDALDADHTRQVRALEFAGVRAALDADELADEVVREPVATLARLHAVLTDGLVDPDRVGTPRELDQAVTDASTGRVLYFASPPDRIAGELALLEGWLTSAATREHALLVSGVLHHEVLRVHPFDAANGRLARAASRLLLRAHGLDPDGLPAPEVALAEDPLGYHEEVARSVRRRDLTIWLERWSEAVTDGLRDVARDLDLLDVEVPGAVGSFLADHPGTFTVADHRAGRGLEPAASREELERLLDAGRIRRVPGARGLRYAHLDPT